MTKLISKIGAGLAAASLLATAFAPTAFAANSVTISGNGEGSRQFVLNTSTSRSLVGQGNLTLVRSTITNNSNTGNNLVIGNTGSNVTLTGGGVLNTSSVGVGGSSNAATLTNPCGCVGGNTVNITGNGEYSHQTVITSQHSSSLAIQANVTAVGSQITQNSNTGGNQVISNTGSNITLIGGGVTSGADLTVTGSSNSLTQ